MDPGKGAGTLLAEADMVGHLGKQDAARARAELLDDGGADASARPQDQAAQPEASTSGKSGLQECSDNGGALVNHHMVPAASGHFAVSVWAPARVRRPTGRVWRGWSGMLDNAWHSAERRTSKFGACALFSTHPPHATPRHPTPRHPTPPHAVTLTGSLCMRVVLQAITMTYPERSLLLLRKTNSLRKLLIYIVNSKLFDQFILTMILGNCITLALGSSRQGFDGTPLGAAIAKMEYLWVVVFTAEMGCKVIAMGFVLAPGTYLRDGARARADRA